MDQELDLFGRSRFHAMSLLVDGKHFHLAKSDLDAFLISLKGLTKDDGTISNLKTADYVVHLQTGKDPVEFRFWRDLTSEKCIRIEFKKENYVLYDGSKLLDWFAAYV